MGCIRHNAVIQYTHPPPHATNNFTISFSFSRSLSIFHSLFLSLLLAIVFLPLLKENISPSPSCSLQSFLLRLEASSSFESRFIYICLSTTLYPGIPSCHYISSSTSTSLQLSLHIQLITTLFCSTSTHTYYTHNTHTHTHLKHSASR